MDILIAILHTPMRGEFEKPAPNISSGILSEQGKEYHGRT